MDSSFARSNFVDSSFARSNFAGSDFAGSDFAGSDFAGSDFAGSDFVGSDVVGSDFTSSFVLVFAKSCGLVSLAVRREDGPWVRGVSIEVVVFRGLFGTDLETVLGGFVLTDAGPVPPESVELPDGEPAGAGLAAESFPPVFFSLFRILEFRRRIDSNRRSTALIRRVGLVLCSRSPGPATRLPAATR